MSDISRKLNQCRKPTDDSGKLVVEEMNKSHFQVTSWGLEKISILPSSVILDIGCGGKKTVARLASIAVEGKIFGIDHSPDCVNWSKEYNKKLITEGRVEIIHTSVEKMPFKDSQFDVVTAVKIH